MPISSTPSACAADLSSGGFDIKTLLNLIWLVCAGLWLALGYLFAGLIMCLFIVTIPFGIAAFRMAIFALWPFGNVIVAKPSAGVGSGLMNVVWFVLCGWWLAIGHIVTAIACAITIIGISLALGNLKMLPVSLVPFGKDIVPVAGLRTDQRLLYRT
ncbi:YccF domain-containing protein [Nostocoides vanveenii]|uniref:YccF domain-containing protein n=1 Tax=Nostocoides vanveenii TaxID=330835 RepID=A0ABP4WAW1_9MICO